MVPSLPFASRFLSLVTKIDLVVIYERSILRLRLRENKTPASNFGNIREPLFLRTCCVASGAKPGSPPTKRGRRLDIRERPIENEQGRTLDDDPHHHAIEANNRPEWR